METVGGDQSYPFQYVNERRVGTLTMRRSTDAGVSAAFLGSGALSDNCAQTPTVKNVGPLRHSMLPDALQ